MRQVPSDLCTGRENICYEYIKEDRHTTRLEENVRLYKLSKSDEILSGLKLRNINASTRATVRYPEHSKLNHYRQVHFLYWSFRVVIIMLSARPMKSSKVVNEVYM